MSTAAPERHLRQEVREYIALVMESADWMSVEKLIRMCRENFAGNEWIEEMLIREGLAAIVPALAADVRHERRTQVRRNKGGTDLERRVRIASIFEHVGSGYSKRLLDMKRPDHLFAASEREKQAAGHIRWANFHRAIAALHKDDTTPTAKLKQEDVSRVWTEIIESD